MKIIIILLYLFFFLISCHSSDYYTSNGCDGHGGVVMCYREFASTHGHLLCRDGTRSSIECY